MTDMEQALTISGAIFVAMLASQYGRRKYSWHKVALPLLAVAGVGWSYLGDLPTATADLVVYLAGIGLGVLFGVAAAGVTGVERGADGVARTRCGYGFVAVWVGLFAVRIGFIALADDNAWFRNQLGTFTYHHGIVQDAIAPFFVLMALATVLVRVGLVGARVRRLPRVAAVPAAPAPAKVAA